MSYDFHDIINQIGDYPAYLLVIPEDKLPTTIKPYFDKATADHVSIFDCIVFVRKHFKASPVSEMTSKEYYAKLLLQAIINFYTEYCDSGREYITSLLISLEVKCTDEQTGATFKEHINATVQCCVELVQTQFSESHSELFLRRNGLNGNSQHTLEQLGEIEGITRERVRQKLQPVESTIVAQLQTPMSKQKNDLRIHPFNTTLPNMIRRIIIEHDNRLSEDAFSRSIQFEFPDEVIDQHSAKIQLLFRYLGIRREVISPVNLAYLHLTNYGDSKSQDQEEMFVKVAGLLADHFCSEEPRGYTQTELTNLIATKIGVFGLDTTYLTDVFAFLEITETVDDTYRVKYLYIQKRTNQCIRILEDNGGTLPLHDIVQFIATSPSHFLRQEVNERNIANILASYNRVKSIGRSGIWTLTSSEAETGTIVDYMNQFFDEKGETARPEEIFEYVNAKRPLARASIQAYLSQDALFAKYAEGKYGPASWQDKLQIWNRQTTAEAITDYFATQELIEVEFSELIIHISHEAQVSARRARGMINGSDAVETRELHGKTFAKLVTTERTAKRQTVRSNGPTQQERIVARIIDLLNQQPDFALPLNEVVDRMVVVFECIDKTIYGAITRSGAFSKFKNADDQVIVLLNDDNRQTHTFIV